MLALEVALMSDRGGRKYNEDACGHWHSRRHLCCVLADGAGGHGGGDIASKLAVQELIGRFSTQPSEGAAELDRLLRVTNDVLISERVPGTARQDMHSTVVCLVIDFVQHRAHWAHSGDSRMYWFRQGRLLDRTRDHSLVQGLVDSGVLTADQIRTHPKRSELRSALAPTTCSLAMCSCSAPTACGSTWKMQCSSARCRPQPILARGSGSWPPRCARPPSTRPAMTTSAR